MIKYHHDIDQGTEEWFAVRLGLITASEMKHVVSRKTDKKTGIVSFKTPDDDKAIKHMYELATQRRTKYVEPTYVSDDMLKGVDGETEAKIIYDKNYDRLENIGFITNDELGFKVGYSPDAKLIGKNAGVEVKSSRQKSQMQTIVEADIPSEHIIQVQTGLMVTKWDWIDFISYNGGMEMLTLKIFPDRVIQDAIAEAAASFEKRIEKTLEAYYARIADKSIRLIPTERKIVQEMHL